MSLKERINEEMKAAMRNGETAKRDAIRLLNAAIKQQEVDGRVTLGDADIVAVIEKMLKQRRDSISQYEAAGRQELADAEKFEVQVLSQYMPARMSAEAIAVAVQAAVVEMGASRASDMGKVMAVLKPQLAGKADMGEVSRQVKAALSGAGV
ncbi:GatB/YqeY domain-containing protein [Dentiradicibacter hellwigii]|uniref:GatB/YqeY domain-containing protein n=1 Tax=Dentiradicibacter hellwigii TaxID=3149053 RepID=A0ABV4UFW6_9RHOO